jgi:flagellar assembly protein FliH
MASVLKSHELVHTAHAAHAEIFNFEDVADRAQRYLDTIRQQAAKMIDDASSQAEKLRQQADAAGRQDAEKYIQQQAEQLANKLLSEKLTGATNHLKQLGQQLETANQQWLSQWQRSTIELATLIAEKIIHRQTEQDPGILLEWLGQAMRLAQSGRKVIIRIHPESRLRLGDSLEKSLTAFQSGCDFEIRDDDSIQREGIVVDTPDGQIDVQLKTQLSRLESELK